MSYASRWLTCMHYIQELYKKTTGTSSTITFMLQILHTNLASVAY